MKPWIVVVGGFLGAGKTSLILAASRLLAERGLRCAVVLNDQGGELVDSRYAKSNNLTFAEVTGGCFCCRFSELTAAMDKMRSHAPDVIFAEPVGSCTDIVATVLNPLREEFDHYRLAPFTVLIDPARAGEVTKDNADQNLAFLFRNQLYEADLVCLSKADLHPTAHLPGIQTRYLSARTGQGIQEWLNEILSGSLEPGSNALEIDYAQYARAEAALAWLNLSFVFEPNVQQTPASVIGPFLDRLNEAFSTANISIVHLKIFDASSSGWLKAAICSNGEEPTVEGDLDASPSPTHELLVNLRALGNPRHVEEILQGQLLRLDGKIQDLHLDCFSPSPPRPERRVTKSRP